MFYGQNKSNNLQNPLHVFLNNTIYKKKPDLPEKKPKVVKDEGGVEGRYDRGQRFNFFLGFPKKGLHCML